MSDWAAVLIFLTQCGSTWAIVRAFRHVADQLVLDRRERQADREVMAEILAALRHVLVYRMAAASPSSPPLRRKEASHE